MSDFNKEIDIQFTALVYYYGVLLGDLGYLSPEDADEIEDEIDILKAIIDRYMEEHKWLEEKGIWG